MKDYFSSQDGSILILVSLTLVGFGIYLYNHEKWAVDTFGSALLLAINSRKTPNTVPTEQPK